jgi:hypothetical protein
MRPLVQIISKPIVAPFHDGTKCFVRDLSNHVEGFEIAVLGGRERPRELTRAQVVNLHAEAGQFAPGLRENLKTLSWLIVRSRADLWHFAFAPNPRSSAAAKFARGLRRVPTLQTVVSPPRHFSEPEALLFGDIVVTQSRWTRDQFRGAFGFRGLKAPRLEVIHPVAPAVERPSEDDKSQLRAELGVAEDEPLIVYPGDLEMSCGGARVAELARAFSDNNERGTFVFAYRTKTQAAEPRRAELERGLDPARVRFIANTPLIHALLASARVIVFPVDDLYGKVDLPIVLLEALRLGTPVVVSDEGPLRELEPATRLAWDPRLWSERILSPIKSGNLASARGDLGNHEPERAARAYERLYAELLGRTP